MQQGQNAPAPTAPPAVTAAPFELIPWWGRLDKVLLYPFSMSGIVTIVFLVVVEFMRNFAGFVGFMGPFMVIILTGIILSIAFAVVRRSADGYEDLPEIEFTDIWTDWAAPGLKFFALTATLFAPAILLAIGAIIAVFSGGIRSLVEDPSLVGHISFAQIGFAVFLAFLAMLIYPLAITILAMSHSYLNAINPMVWFAILSRVGAQYAMVLGALVVLGGMGAFASGVLMIIVPIPIIPLLLGACARTYVTLVACHLLGWFIFQNHEALGLRPTRLVEEARKRAPKVMPQVAPEGMQTREGGVIDPSTQTLPADVFNPVVERQLPDMSIPDDAPPQFPGSFAGGPAPGPRTPPPGEDLSGPGAPPGWGQPGPSWDEAPQDVPEGGWNPFGGMEPGAAAGPGGFLEVDDPMDNPGMPMGMPAAPAPAPQTAAPDLAPQPAAPQAPAGDDPWAGMPAPGGAPSAAPDLNWQPAGGPTPSAPAQPPTTPQAQPAAQPAAPQAPATPQPSAPANGPAAPAEHAAPGNGAGGAATAPPTPEPPPLAPDLQALLDQVGVAIGRGDQEGATVLAGKLIGQLWDARLVQRAHDVYKKLAAAFQDACLHPTAQIRIAREMDAMGEKQAALAAWRALVVVHDAHPQAPRALLRCGELYVEMGRTDWAKSCYQSILQKYPNADVAAVAQTRLRQMGA